jgi:hypothetical protein
MVIAAGYSAATNSEKGVANQMTSGISITIQADKGVIPSKAELAKVGHLISQEIETIVDALTAEKDDPIFRSKHFSVSQTSPNGN